MLSSHMRRWPYSQAGRYELFRPSQAEPAGHIGSNMLIMTPGMILGAFDGLVRVDDEGAWILCSTAGALPERIECLRRTRANEVLELRPNPVEDQSPYLRPHLTDALRIDDCALCRSAGFVWEGVILP